jgi:hypothetical protein
MLQDFVCETRPARLGIEVQETAFMLESFFGLH